MAITAHNSYVTQKIGRFLTGKEKQFPEALQDGLTLAAMTNNGNGCLERLTGQFGANPAPEQILTALQESKKYRQGDTAQKVTSYHSGSNVLYRALTQANKQEHPQIYKEKAVVFGAFNYPP